jgi:hypothetical protein
MDPGERAARFKFLIRDRDSKFTMAFDQVLAGNGARIIKIPVRSPRANSDPERYVGTLRRECPGHLLIHGERHLRRMLAEHARHYNEHRPHQPREQRPPLHQPGQPIDMTAQTKRTHVIHGLINEYRRAAQHQLRASMRVLARHKVRAAPRRPECRPWPFPEPGHAGHPCVIRTQRAAPAGTFGLMQPAASSRGVTPRPGPDFRNIMAVLADVPATADGERPVIGVERPIRGTRGMVT